ncbi:MAG: Acetyl-/propionyl-coenzyme carboxylase alpha chain [Fibrobacterota bacterium]|jgi:urea carboxylase
MFTKVLIANRGAIACRIERTLRRMGVMSISVHSEADRGSLHVSEADLSVCIGGAKASESYLSVEAILRAARETGAQAIHPGYGFLSENPAFAQACEDAGIVFLGPTPDQMRVFGLKHTAREAARVAGVPMLPGTGILSGADEAVREAARIGYPVMLKSTAGGGGIGMRRCAGEDELRGAWEAVEALATANFKDPGLYLEKLVVRARHVEVQVFGNGKGRVVSLGERDCSAQRRNQKVLEETPAPGISEETRQELSRVAVLLCESVQYRSAGTVEFVLDADTGEFWFLEVNTRLQVEHGVTEEVVGIDLVEWMVRQGAGESFLPVAIPARRGVSMQARLYAEDPVRQFAPSSGRLTEVVFPPGARVETWVETGCEVPPWYDPMVAKLIVHAPTRSEAIAKLDQALAATRLCGIGTNRTYLRQILASPEFREGKVWTGMLASIEPKEPVLEILEGGAQTTVQDWPGRSGHWDVGIPPSGPMDSLSHRLANLAVGNPEGAAALEFVLKGPSLKAHVDCTACLGGADFAATLDGRPVEPWTPFTWMAGQILKTKAVSGAGARGVLAVAGGFDVPEYLGSRSTFTLGGFGGHGGRAVRSGDLLALALTESVGEIRVVPPSLRPQMATKWEIGVLPGPQASPDYFRDEDIDDFYAASWKVHYNSDRTGVRLIGPKPKWARPDGGEAGLHPSNLHDNAYVVGTVDFTGDMPVILGPDGPSLGGFACPATIALAELWKLGQLRAGDEVEFRPLSHPDARALQDAQESALEAFTKGEIPVVAKAPSRAAWREVSDGIRLHSREADMDKPALLVRQDGDDAFLVEFGPMALDLELRLRVHALWEAVRTAKIDGIRELTPGIRSLQVIFDPRIVERSTLLGRILSLEDDLPPVDEMEFPNRVVHLPLSWDDPSTRLAIEKYMATVRPDAPWCPSNIEFIRRVNGLDSIEEVKRIVFDAQYLVLGLGDVYLGAPVATPLDPRHRLVTTKYNPARTWTPENAVGIGGAYMCVYGMEGPGGYQFVGRTVQMWNRWKPTTEFVKPWLLRFFDVIRFHEVSADELLRLREEFPRGRASLRIEESVFRMADYRQFLSQNAESIESFRTVQRAAFQAEREHWKATGLDVAATVDAMVTTESESGVPAGCEGIAADLPGSVWKVAVEVGQVVSEGDTVVVLESMKMESPVAAPASGTVREIRCRSGQSVVPGQILVVLEP